MHEYLSQDKYTTYCYFFKKLLQVYILYYTKASATYENYHNKYLRYNFVKDLLILINNNVASQLIVYMPRSYIQFVANLNRIYDV